MILLGDDVLSAFLERKARPNFRQTLILAVVSAVFLFLCVRTLSLGLYGNRRVRGADSAAAEVIRADIVDRNGEILAKNVYTFNLVLNARKISDADKAASLVHSVFPDISVAAVLAELKSGKGNIELKRNIDKDKAAIIRREKIDGVNAWRAQRREYPKHNGAAHIVGFVFKDGRGAEGMELVADERLSSDPRPLELAIDARVQAIIWAELSQKMKEFRARAAMAILMNARTGEIVAAVNLPDYDPENIGDYKSENRRFRIMRDNFEMGSIFKIFNTALALSYGIPITKTFNVADPFFVDGKKIGEASGFRPPAKNLNVAQVMQHSSNSGSAQIALSLPNGSQLDFFRRLGFDRAVETDFGKTSRPIYPTSSTPTDRSRWSFGHGIAVTPLHVLLAANAVASDGKYIMPTIYKRNFVPRTEQVIDRSISRQIRKILFKTGDTSGKFAAQQIKGVNIGGKTSTAQKPVDGAYSQDKNIAAFFVAFPIEAPKWSMLVIFDEPQSVPRTAAYNAVPTAGEILNAIIPLL